MVAKWHGRPTALPGDGSCVRRRPGDTGPAPVFHRAAHDRDRPLTSTGRQSLLHPGQRQGYLLPRSQPRSARSHPGAHLERKVRAACVGSEKRSSQYVPHQRLLDLRKPSFLRCLRPRRHPDLARLHAHRHHLPGRRPGFRHGSAGRDRRPLSPCCATIPASPCGAGTTKTPGSLPCSTRTAASRWILGGQKLYNQVLPDICARLDPRRPYWPSSPCGGDEPQLASWRATATGGSPSS